MTCSISASVRWPVCTAEASIKVFGAPRHGTDHLRACDAKPNFGRSLIGPASRRSLQPNKGSRRHTPWPGSFLAPQKRKSGWAGSPDIKAKGGKAIAVQGDVAKAADVKKIFAETKRAFGRVDILVNNAGVYNLLPLEEVTEEDFHRHFNINVLGLLLATQEAAKLFGGEGGSVINIGSVASDLNSPNTVVYTCPCRKLNPNILMV